MFKRLDFSRKLFAFLSAMGIAAILGACGGGGDDPAGGGGEFGGSGGYTTPVATAPTTPIAITTANSQDVASEVVNSIAASGSGTAFVGVQTNSSSTTSVSLLDVTKKVIEIYNQSQSQIVSGVEVLCDLGSIDFPDGPTGTITFNGCVLGDIIFNGSIIVTGTGSSTSFNGSIIYSGLTVSDYLSGVEIFSINGAMDVNVTYGTPPVESGTITVSLLVTTFGNEVIDLTNYTLTYSVNDLGNETININYTVNSTLLNGSVTVTTTSDLLYYFGSDYPYAGELVITGENNSNVKLTVVPGGTGSILDSVTVETDEDGDGIYESGPTTLTWADLTS